MPKICPECGNEYDEVVKDQSSIVVDADEEICRRGVSYEGENLERSWWYVHKKVVLA